MSGWIKLHRKLTEWEWYSDVNTSRVFMHLLLVANHKDNQWRGIPIKRGQRLTSISKLADETNLSVKNIRTSIKRLKATSEVASYSNAQHTVFTIVNYDLYQQEASEEASEGQAKGKQGATNKNVKNDNNEDNNPLVQPRAKPKKYKFNSYQMDFAKWAYSIILVVDPSRPEPTYEAWANDIRLMIEVDNLNGDEMVKVFTWANKDPFWGANILSTSKFRKQYRSLLVKMNNGGNQSSGSPQRTQAETDQFTTELNDQFERSQAAKARREAREKL